MCLVVAEATLVPFVSSFMASSELSVTGKGTSVVVVWLRRASVSSLLSRALVLVRQDQSL